MTEAADAVRTHGKYERLIARAKAVPAPRTLVVHPCDETSLRGALEAAEAGIIIPVLVGPSGKITAVAHEHKLFVVGLERRGEHLGRIDPQAGEELRVRAGDPGRGAHQTVAVRVLADGDEDLPDRFLDAGQVDGLLDRGSGELAVDQPCR